jgi:hypothetical protein
MRSSFAIIPICVAFALSGCGNAESIDPAEIDAENVRREEARADEAATAAKEWEANEEIHISGPGGLDVGKDPTPQAEQGAVTREKSTPPKSQ